MHRERMRGIRRFAEFMEEFNHRKLDLRQLAPYSKAARIFLPATLGAQLDTGNVDDNVSEARTASPAGIESRKRQ